ncbi:flagellar motor switch protein FliM [Rhizobium leguminosarum bv. trifolii]|uniref:Flagellar motor switch protein FliM n=1 Tax=Rhizobium leguminosarum bv. trifolii TaxID=386 RepID=A0A1B8RER0_RHILT|nr:FliM/FliN family flagellar motor switch protein [Rhizobium leguminosarum]AOO89816.1 flagellar motor switch protein FliM [Rhizobium leguminosarum bv. trifolii]MBY5467457.1 flagellar motor switch protein FliM [Rhizobium leguminosarum]MBY5918857.1 flagellar motor switch protein FliM [Rhizobium leguminosarum]NKK94307.1 flagellar motor switch protein FliM [Rhizobium leguminosarum bv. viciae]OBY07223.1 flagellar motor switch protein FliM [Rhizobium leguminosarum bv. trifolii]
MTMSNASHDKPTMDPALLAKLTGGLGDRGRVAKICSSFGEIYSEFFPDVIKSETGLDVTVNYLGCEIGYKNHLIDDLSANVTLVDATLRNWSQNITLACGNGFVITLMEHLLGATANTIEEPADRMLSIIELDLAVMVFDKIAKVLRSAVNAPGGFEPSLSAPHAHDMRARPQEDRPDEFAAAINMSIALAGIVSEFSLIVPQTALLKTKVTPPKPKRQASSNSAEWTEQLGDQVRRSHVTLEAKIRLQDLTLRTISKLMVGDVIPFRDHGDVRVEVSANSKELYVCEFGRSGENYMVRVKDTMNSDDELIRHLMN